MYTVPQRVVGLLLCVGEPAKTELDRLKEEFQDPADIPSIDQTSTDVLRVLYGSGPCKFDAFDLRTNGGFHDALAGLVDECLREYGLLGGVEGGVQQGDDGLRGRSDSIVKRLKQGVEELVKERDKREVGVKLAHQTASLASGSTNLDSVVKELREITQSVRPQEEVVGWSGYLDRAQRELEDSTLRGPELTFGLPDLDNKILLRRANMVTVAARTSHGKSAFCLHMAKRGVKSDLKVAYWCGEDYHVFPHLFASSMFQCPITHLTRYVYANATERGQAESALNLARQFDGQLFVYPAMPLREFESQIRELKPDVLVFDYVQKYAEQFGSDDMRRSTSKATSEFQDMVRRHEAFGFMACQVKRGDGVYRPSRANAPPQSQEPSLYDLKESGDIENYSDAVLILHWPWRDGMDEEASQLDREDYRITIAKDKLGPCGKVRVRYTGEMLTFSPRYNMGGPVE